MADGELVGQLVVMGVLLLLSAFFSGSETAFFSLNSLEKDALRRRAKGVSASFVRTLFSQPDEVLVTILIGNMFVNVFATSISESIGDEFFGEAAELVSIVAMTAILLLIGEMTPKNVAIRHSLSFSHFAARILRFVHTLAMPLVAPLSRLRRWILSAYSRSAEVESARSAAVLSAIRMGYQSGTIQLSELHLLESFFRFKDKTVADVMVPRIDLRPVDISGRVSDLIDSAVAGEPLPRGRPIPVYKQDVDHIVGYIQQRDLIPYRLDGLGSTRISSIVRPIHGVPDTKRLRELMDEMDENDTEVAVVVDEYGGTEGIVTYDTIVEYLFEAFFPGHDKIIQTMGPESYRISGSAEIDAVEETLNVGFETASRTVSGMVIDHIGDLPSLGTEVEIEKYVFRVTGVSDKRITWIEVTKAS
jgi:CBS domain containing-hemolysin-like protein